MTPADPVFLTDRLAYWAEARADETAVTYLNRSWTWAQWYDRVRRLAGAQQEMGIGRAPMSLPDEFGRPPMSKPSAAERGRGMTPTQETTMTETHTLELPDVDLTYDVRGPIPAPDGRPLLLMIGQPMQADGFADLAAQLPDRTVVTYDPRGLGRSGVRRDGRNDQRPEDQAADLHALVEHLSSLGGGGPVDVFGSSGGAVAGLTWVALHPDDVGTLVAHEPPSTWALPNDAEAADRAFRGVREAYQAKGVGAGMATFIGLTMWPGEFTDAYFAQPAPDPAVFGMSTEDDGRRDDALLSERAVTVTTYEYDLDAIKAAPTRVVMGVGEETGDTVTARTTRAVAERLGSELVVFPSHHGGFVGGGPENPYAGKPAEFGVTLREVLDQTR